MHAPRTERIGWTGSARRATVGASLPPADPRPAPARGAALAVAGSTPPTGAGPVLVHSLAWLVAASAVGLLLATLLLAPELGLAFGPLTYGRWVPLHLDWHLYGWCALPLVGLLLRAYLGDRRAALARAVVAVWSASLVFAGIGWLAGGSSGKLFLEFAGPSRLLLALALTFLAAALLVGLVDDGRRRQGRDRRWCGRVALWAVLAPIPAVMFWAAGAGVYPVINPDSGGATGSSLLGSSLGIVAVVLLLPPMLGLRRSLPHRGVRHVAGLLALHFLAFLLLDHGNRSHHQLDQVVALATLFVWLPLLYRYLGSWVWPPESRGWLRAAAVWGCLLLLSGFAAFLPGLLERWKFTNVLVAHAHVALAGLVSCLDVLVLQSLRRQGTRDVFATGSGIWHAGLAIQVAALFAVGLLEAGDPGLLFRPAALVDLLYGLRWIGGALMLAAAWRWLQAARMSVAGEAAP